MAMKAVRAMKTEAMKAVKAMKAKAMKAVKAMKAKAMKAQKTPAAVMAPKKAMKAMSGSIPICSTEYERLLLLRRRMERDHERRDAARGDSEGLRLAFASGVASRRA